MLIETLEEVGCSYMVSQSYGRIEVIGEERSRYKVKREEVATLYNRGEQKRILNTPASQVSLLFTIRTGNWTVG